VRFLEPFLKKRACVAGGAAVGIGATYPHLIIGHAFVRSHLGSLDRNSKRNHKLNGCLKLHRIVLCIQQVAFVLIMM